MKIPLRTPLVLCAFLALIIPAAVRAAPAAQSGGVTLEAVAGFDSYFRSNEPTPIRVAVANEGPDLDARIEIERPALMSDASGKAVYVRPVALPTHSRKVETIYVPGAPGLKGARVRLLQGDNVLAETTLNATPASADDLIVGVLSSAPSTLDFLAGVHSPGDATRIAPLTLDALPAQAIGLESLDLLIIDDAATDGLGTAQRDALRSWIERGGQLIVAGGPGWQATASGLQDLLPATADGTVNLATVGALAAAVPPTAAAMAPGPYVAARLVPNAGSEVALSEGDTPLLVRRAVGQGTVSYLALSTTMAPLNAWAGNAGFWQKTVLRGVVQRTMPPAGVLHYGTAAEALINLPTLQLPSALDLMCLLGIYVAVIGPVNYIILRRLKRLELAWFTIPAVVLLFTGVTYISGISFRGTRPTLHRLAVVRAQAGSATARADLLIGLYSPQRRDYDLRLPGPVAVRPLQTSADPVSDVAVILQNDDAALVQGIRVDIAGMREFTARVAVPGPGLVADVQSSVSSGGKPRVAGSLRNTGSLTLKDARVLLGSSSASIGDLAPGASIEVDEVLSSSGSGPSALYGMLGLAPYGYYGSDRDNYRRWQLAWSAFSDTGAYGSVRSLGQAIYLVAWVDGFPGEAEIPGTGAETSDLSLYLIQLASTSGTGASGTGGTVLASDTDMDFTVAEQTGPVYVSEIYNLQLGDSASVSYLFTPRSPYDTTKAVTMTYTLDTFDHTAVLPGVTVWNWGERRWDSAAPAAWGRARVIPGPISRYINVDGEVMLRIASPKAELVTLSDFQLTIEAKP